MGCDECGTWRSVTASVAKRFGGKKTDFSCDMLENTSCVKTKLHWIACDECGKWRRVNAAVVSKFSGPTVSFSCGYLENTKCSDPEDRDRNV